MKRIVGLSTCNKTLNEELFLHYAEAGIGAAEISLSPEEYPALDCKQAAAWAKAAGVDLWSFHLPFGPFEQINPASLSAELRQKTVEYLGELIRRAGDVGIRRMIIHPSGEPIPAEERADQMKYAMQSLAILTETAARAGGVLCVEDLPRTCLGRDSAEILTLLQADDRMRVCFDTNHLLREDVCDFVHAVGDKLETVHVSDYDNINERHWLPGEGVIDWNRLMDALDEVGYQGAWMYELGFHGIPERIPRPRDLVFADFVKNAEELHARQPLTVLAKGVPGTEKFVF